MKSAAGRDLFPAEWGWRKTPDFTHNFYNRDQTTSTMRDFLVVIVGLYLLGASVAMSTGTFVRRFPEWTNADKVTFFCNDTEKIAQYCDTGHQSCRNKSSPGVSLDKHGLTITNCTYNSWSCEAQSYIHGIRHTEKFTVDFSNQHTITSPSPGAPITSPSPGNNESHSDTIAAGVTVPIICVVVVVVVVLALMIILYILYRKRNPNQEDIEMGDKFLQPVCGISHPR